jgi:hypothetical protein
MSVRTSRPVVIDVDMKVVRDVLERAGAVLSSDDHACLVVLVTTFVDISNLVRERGTTIARLRRLFGLASSEKSADVLGDDASTAAPPSESGSSSDPPAGLQRAAAGGCSGPRHPQRRHLHTDPRVHGQASREAP